MQHKDDQFDLNRFIIAQGKDFKTALRELKKGEKHSHWMWYIFPQIEGLGNSHMARLYAIQSKEEAEQYLQHPVLRQRLVTCTEAVLFNRCPVDDIFEYPDESEVQIIHDPVCRRLGTRLCV